MPDYFNTSTLLFFSLFAHLDPLQQERLTAMINYHDHNKDKNCYY